MSHCECAQCHSVPPKGGAALFLLGPAADLGCDIFGGQPGEGDPLFCSPGCMLAFMEPRAASLARAFEEEDCFFCGEPVERGIAYSAPYGSLLDTIGAGIMHAECFLKALRQDAEAFKERGFLPWFMTREELPGAGEAEAEEPTAPGQLESLAAEEVSVSPSGEGEAALDHESAASAQAPIARAILKLIHG
jgi:hypothetical protein